MRDALFHESLKSFTSLDINRIYLHAETSWESVLMSPFSTWLPLIIKFHLIFTLLLLKLPVLILICTSDKSNQSYWGMLSWTVHLNVLDLKIANLHNIFIEKVLIFLTQIIWMLFYFSNYQQFHPFPMFFFFVFYKILILCIHIHN